MAKEFSKTFMGYRRENGRVGVRNHVVILPVDDISNAAAEAVASVTGAAARVGEAVASLTVDAAAAALAVRPVIPLLDAAFMLSWSDFSSAAFPIFTSHLTKYMQQK